MSDPLSVAASITGLIALAGQLYIALDGFISNVRDAPLLAGTIQAEVKSFRNSLNALHNLLHDPAFCKSRRAALISADYVVVSFTDAVLVFSQLESSVLPLTKFTEFGVVARTQWTRKKTTLNELVARLQWQKHTLVLQLNILSCASDIEAERNRQVLDTLICERLGKDRDMERRLELVEQQLQTQTNGAICDRASIISTETTGSDHTIRAGDQNISSTSLSTTASYQHAFEELLNNSWVYRRNKNREEDMSMRSSVLRMSAWSVLSDMSLANISIIAVMSLPVQIQELSNGDWYSTNPGQPKAAVEQDEPPSSSNSVVAEPPDEDEDTDDEFETTWRKNGNRRSYGSNNQRLQKKPPPSPYSKARQDQISDVSPSTGSLFPLPPPPSAGFVLSEFIPLSGKTDQDRFQEMLDEARRTGPQHRMPFGLDPQTEEELREGTEGYEDLSVDDDFDDEVYYCKKCEEVLPEGKAYELVGNRWHLDCFRCETCDVLLNADANLLLLGDGSLICNDCTYSCHACNEKIEDLAILTGDQAFCANCFKCQDCNRKIEDLKYGRTDGGIYCISCYDARRKMSRQRKRWAAPGVPLEDENSSPEPIDDNETSSGTGLAI